MKADESLTTSCSRIRRISCLCAGVRAAGSAAKCIDLDPRVAGLARRPAHFADIHTGERFAANGKAVTASAGRSRLIVCGITGQDH